MDLDARFNATLEIAEEAAALALKHFENRRTLTVEHKGLQDYVSAADREVETLIRRRLTDRFPKDAQLGEEEGGIRQADALWVIDPIDGTTNFLRGLGDWSVCLAFLVNGVVEHGVMFAPYFRERYVARRGRGAFCNEHPLKVTTVSRLDEAVIGYGSNIAKATQPYVDLLKKTLERKIDYRRPGSASMTFTAVASGRLDGYYEADLNPWDVMPGMLLVTEAGGRCNAYVPGGPVLATNHALYDELAALML